MRGLIACLALAALPVAAQQDFSRVEIRTEQLAPGVYMLAGAGGNVGLSVGDDGAFLVDDQFAPLTPKLQAAIARVSAKPVRFVLNTHWHYDHTGGNENLGSAGAVIVAHDNVRKRMSVAGFVEFLGKRTPTKAEPPAALPIVTFTQDVTFHLNGDEIRVLHLPAAHTDGDAIVHFSRRDVLHMGDIFFHRLYPFIDTASGGTVQGVLRAVDRALGLAGEGTKIIPGHGPLATRSDLQAYRDMLATVSGRIGSQIAAGRSLADIKASKPTAEFDAAWGQGFIKPDAFVEMLHDSLRRHP